VCARAMGIHLPPSALAFCLSAPTRFQWPLRGGARAHRGAPGARHWRRRQQHSLVVLERRRGGVAASRRAAVALRRFLERRRGGVRWHSETCMTVGGRRARVSLLTIFSMCNLAVRFRSRSKCYISCVLKSINTTAACSLDMF
jgi:hypothetical protein